MSTPALINAAPMVRQLGTQDLSPRPPVLIPEAIPTHLPKSYFFAKKGPTTPELTVGDSRAAMYGADTFDELQKWCNHATVMTNVINKQGNQQMTQRVVPPDAGPESNLLLALDVLTVSVPVYERNNDGSYKLDQAGNKIQAHTGSGQTAVPVTTPGYKIKWVVTHYDTAEDALDFGLAAKTAGDQTDVGSGTQSERWPVLQLKASDIGEDGNNRGLRIWAPTALSLQPINPSVLEGINAFPFKVAMISRSKPSSSAVIYETLDTDQDLTVTFKKGAINPVTTQPMFIGDLLLEKYRNITDPTYPRTFGLFGEMKLYEANIKALLQLFYASETAYLETATDYSDVGNDFIGADDEEYLFNLVGLQNSAGTPYATVQFATANNAVTLSQYQNLYAAGGSDGTMNNAVFDDLVIAEMAKYADENDEVQNTAVNVESIIYDSGFGLNAKYALLNFISVRKDTFCVLATHTAGQPALDNSAEESLAITLRTRAEFWPESDYFGTPVMRALIMGRSGTMVSSQWTDRMPLTIEVAAKAAAYMGAGDGKWKNGKSFTGAPGSIVSTMTNINITWTPATVRNKNWSAGLNWVQSFDRRQNFIPALKTVYSDDTSVLNSFITAMAVVEVNKVNDRAWRQFSGVDGLTPAQLVEKVNTFITQKTQGRFDGRFVITPDTQITSQDAQRGYSWTTAVDLYAPPLFTSMTTWVRTRRISDLTAANSSN